MKGTRDLEEHLLPNSQLPEEAQGGCTIRHTSLQLRGDPARGHLLACFMTQPLLHHSRGRLQAGREGSRGADLALGEGTQGPLGAGAGHRAWRTSAASTPSQRGSIVFPPSPLVPAVCLYLLGFHRAQPRVGLTHVVTSGPQVLLALQGGAGGQIRE